MWLEADQGFLRIGLTWPSISLQAGLGCGGRCSSVIQHFFQVLPEAWHSETETALAGRKKLFAVFSRRENQPLRCALIEKKVVWIEMKWQTMAERNGSLRNEYWNLRVN